MEKTITAADANRKFSQVLREVREGQTYIVTNRGKPVARIVPVQAEDESRVQARRKLLARLEKQSTTDIGRWVRDELYEGDQEN